MTDIDWKARAEAAEGQLAALREAAENVARATGAGFAGARLRSALADLPAAAAKRDERLRAEGRDAERERIAPMVERFFGSLAATGEPTWSREQFAKMTRDQLAEYAAQGRAMDADERRADIAEARSAALEEAARVCDAEANAERRLGRQKAAIAAFIVAAGRIRDLSSQPPQPDRELLREVAERAINAGHDDIRGIGEAQTVDAIIDAVLAARAGR